MIEHLGVGRAAVLLLLALLVFGPERLPLLAGQLGRGIRQLRETLGGLTAEVRESVGPELGSIDLASLQPRRLVSSLLAEPAPAAPAVRVAAQPLPPATWSDAT